MSMSGVYRQAMALEETRMHGHALGLTEKQSTEVIDSWTAWYRSIGAEINYRRIRDSLTDRAIDGVSWEPPTPQLTEIAIPFASMMDIPITQAAATLQMAMRASARGVDW